jgi:hypothetical protein
MAKFNYDWDKEFRNYSTFSACFQALKSCVEADEPLLLGEIIRSNKNASIYALILCFTTIPSVKCIEYLVSEGTSLDETFSQNPFKQTPQEFLNFRFNTTRKEYMKARNAIYNAINRGKVLHKNKEHTAILINSTTSNTTIFHKVAYSLLGPKNVKSST